MAEEAAKKKRAHTEELIAIIVLVFFVPFMIGGILWWPAETEESGGDTGLPEGTYKCTFLGSRPATDSDVAVAALEVNGETFFVNEHDLSGSAADDPDAFFDNEGDQPITVTVENGLVEEWAPARLP